MTQAAFRTLAYEPGRLTLLDQTRLPREETYVDLTHLEEVAPASASGPCATPRS